MKPVISTLIALVCLVGIGRGQSVDTTLPPEQFGLQHLTEYLGLTPDDIGFRQDYTEPDSFRLQVVADLMEEPLGMIDYGTSLRKAYAKGQPEYLAAVLFSDLKTVRQDKRTRAYQPTVDQMQNRRNLYFTNQQLNQLLMKAAVYIDHTFPQSTEKMLSGISRQQRGFLTDQFKEILVSRVEEENYSPMQLDSVEKAEEGYVDEFVTFGYNIDPDPVVDAGVTCLRELMLEIQAIQLALSSGQATVQQLITAVDYLPDDVDLNTYLGKQPGWAVGGPGNDYYEGDYKFILDVGGNDVYDLSYDEGRPHGVIVIDLSGDDHYRGRTDFAIGSGCLSAGLLLDFAGNDRYDSKSFALGSGFFGFGIVYDAAGDDRYDGDTHVQGAGSFGLGILLDEGGRDIYNGALYCQAFGFVQGVGVIYDSEGSDTYYAGGKYKDILRYEDHYLSLSQGFGYGLRPSLSGGIGAIVDYEGNDVYYADIFAQGCSYWWSLGMIYDSSGNDNYQCFQYGQGAATHMSLGAMIDDHGNDVYFGKGLMQGCGHDYSCGLILDRHGDDTYTAYDLSQGAGSANGVGIQIDNHGADRYFSRNPDNTQGYGNPRRDFGSIGLFIDLAGEDQYAGNGRDNFYWRTNSKWGGGMDIEMTPPPDTTTQNTP